SSKRPDRTRKRAAPDFPGPPRRSDGGGLVIHGRRNVESPTGHAARRGRRHLASTLLRGGLALRLRLDLLRSHDTLLAITGVRRHHDARRTLVCHRNRRAASRRTLTSPEPLAVQRSTVSLFKDSNRS